MGTTVDPQAIACGLKRGREATEKARKNSTALCVVFWGNTVLADRLLKLKKAKNYVGCYTVSKRGWYVYVDL